MCKAVISNDRQVLSLPADLLLSFVREFYILYRQYFLVVSDISELMSHLTSLQLHASATSIIFSYLDNTLSAEVKTRALRNSLSPSNTTRQRPEAVSVTIWFVIFTLLFSHSPVTTHHSPLAINHLPLTLATHHSPLTTYH